MSLVVEFTPHTGSRLQLWSQGLDISPGLYVGILVLELLGLDYRSQDSPHRLPLPELNTPSEAERMTNDFVRRMKQIHKETDVNTESADAVSASSDTKPLRVTLDFSQASEDLIAAQASERGLTSEEYIATIADCLVELADLVTPKDMPQTRDPDIHHDTPIEEILNEAVREMKVNQIKNREYAVKAITQKNNLRAEVDKEERILADYKRKALTAIEAGNRELAQRFYKESLLHEQTLTTMRTLLTQATDIAEKVKQQIVSEEERIRVRTSKALLLKANLTATAIAFRLDMLLEEMQPPAQEAFQQNFEDWIQSQRPPEP